MTSPTGTTTADPESANALISPRRRNFIFIGVLLGMLLAALDQTIVATPCRPWSPTSAARVTSPGW